MREISFKIEWRAMVYIEIKLDYSIKVSGSTIFLMEKVMRDGLINHLLKDFIEMGLNMGKGSTFGMMGVIIQEIGSKILSKDLENIFGKTELLIQENEKTDREKGKV